MLGECPQPWLIAQQVQTMQVESSFPQKFWMHMFHFSFSFWHHSWKVWFLVFWVKLFLSLERFEIKSFSLMSWWCALAWSVFTCFPGHLVASIGLVTSVLGFLFIYSMDDTFLSTFSVLYARDSVTPRLGLLDFISLPLILQWFLYSAFWEFLSTIFANISSVDSISAINLYFQEISSLSVPCSFNTAFTSSLRLQLFLASSLVFWATLLCVFLKCLAVGSSFNMR